MIGYLGEDLSFCQLDGRLFVLDIRKDRYFQRCQALKRQLRDYLDTPNRTDVDGTDVDVAPLIERGVFSPEVPTSCATTKTMAPRHGALEVPNADIPASVPAASQGFLSVAAIRRQLNTRPLKSILTTLSGYRQRNALPPGDDDARYHQRPLEASMQCHRGRPFVPIPTRRLIDPLAMVRFLAAHGLHARLVLSIAADPFSAHAWVQHGSWVLNGALGTTQAHVPTQVI
ncbi:lasso peptide biosynthesis B2 protein [Oleiagrimonas sp. C23AA]|uniref:lasso peptide biosynthesis B2 protein n=1 Tax=Oleiagrimonas sp. C23AA TaxID=2719047 RepID=UPI00141D80DC|nr:lasso peptide biosynthesis B2 protein [Oleiagrimonas sp. C23AA]NII09492.1 lasso peptide biosynthesis B2 protein [Oleiagrimonas sp. C23AA]